MSYRQLGTLRRIPLAKNIGLLLLVLGLLAAGPHPAAGSPAAQPEADTQSQPAGTDHQWKTAAVADGSSRPLFTLSGLPGRDQGALNNVPEVQHRFLAPWSGLGRNAVAIFSGSNALLHLSALGGTFLIIETGLDTQVHNFFVRHTFFENASHPAVSLGSIFPVLLGGGFLASGLIGGSSQLGSAGGAVLQASLLALSYTSALKALTGRPGPEHGILDDNQASTDFRFGFLRGGVFHGWPSGHMMANTAAVTSLLSFYKDNIWLDIAGGTYLAYMFLSVISHGKSSMHWFSDAVAGTLMGYAIGTTVGRDFRRRWENKKEKTAGVSVQVIPQLFGLSAHISW